MQDTQKTSAETPAEKRARLEAALRELEVEQQLEELGATEVPRDPTQDLVDRTKGRAEQAPVPEDWGYWVSLDENDHFVGRWRGETRDETNDRRVFLLWDTDGQPCFSRSYAALGREIDRAAPEVGCTIVIFRGEDYTTAEGNSGFSFGVETEANGEPLPSGAEPPADDGIPF
jgi:hypothetical protein